MKRLFFLGIFIPVFCFAQQEYFGNSSKQALVRTSVVLQNWKIEGVDSSIAEGTVPIEIILPIMDNINLQISHSPAMSRFGDITLNGLSDTYLRGSYIFFNEKMMVSVGVGIPTGKTKFTNDETILSNLLTKNVFKFRLPVFGQGLTASSGILLVHPINEQFVLGGGVNFVYRGEYKYIQNMQYKFNPGNQIGLNIGFDYNYYQTIKLSFDLLYSYYMKDKLDNTEIFGAGSKISAKAGFTYNDDKRMLWVVGRIRYSGKNETWDGTTLITEPKNSNIKQMELDALYRIKLSQIFSFDILFEGRSYIENEYGKGQADIFGGGLGNNVQLTPNLGISMGFKIFLGDAYFNNSVPNYSGSELQLMTTFRL